MVLLSTQHTLLQKVQIKGQFFGARGGSCACNPCDCNPCGCGDSLAPNPPLWRVSGVLVTQGHLGTTDLAGVVLLSLALPRRDAIEGQWEEILLVDSLASSEQLEKALSLFEPTLQSLPAEVGERSPYQRAVYRTPIDFQLDSPQPFLDVSLQLERMILVRSSEKYGDSWPGEWFYHGPMALRESVNWQVQV
jgi:hypothetical protein